MKRTAVTALLLPILLFSLAQNLFACACCAERGDYFESRTEVQDFEKEMLAGIRFASGSELYIDEAGFEIIRGLEGFAEAYEASETGAEFSKIPLTSDFSGTGWKLSLRLGSLNGTLSLPLPAEREYFGADIHDGRGSSGGGPLLYKELRFRGKTGAGTGFFAKGVSAGADFRLVFQGRGNGCNNAEDFTHWRLSVNGPDARYNFFGKLDSGNPAYVFDGSVRQEDIPKFEDHAAAVWNGRKRALNLSSHPDARMFRTRLREAWTGGVNFAGQFIVTYWGCGTGCVQGAIIDARTGKVYFPDELQGMGFGVLGFDIEGEPMEYRKESKLFVIRGVTADNEDPGTTWLVWEGAKFRRLLFEKAR